MLKLVRVAVTGNIASGKSTVCRLFKDLGAYALSADEIVHELLVPMSAVGQRVIELLGDSIVKGGSFDKGAIAERVFDDYALLAQLEAIIHPEVQKVIEARYRELINLTPRYPLFVVEVPLLFESKSDHFFDEIVVVYADEAIAKKRFLKARGSISTSYEKRAGRLLDLEEKKRRASFSICNEGSEKELQTEVKRIYHQLTRDYGSRE